MSRSALNRQEGNVQERERRAEELFETAVEEGRVRQRAKGVLPLWGPEDSFHLNPLLLQNIRHSPYFQKCCQTLNDWNAVVDDIYYQVQHVQPFQTATGSKTPSSAFCLLLRLLTLRMTEHQLKLMLDHEDSPYIRAVAFLYLRYAGPPERVYQWIEPYLYDQEDIQVTVSGGGKAVTMGEFVRQLFSSREYHGTPLPRWPSETERHLQVQLVAADQIAQRAEQHFRNRDRMAYFSRLGSAVMALYGDEENPVTWYPGVVDRVLTRDPNTGHALQHPKYVVTFTEYGNTETVLLGEMDVMDGSWKRDQASRHGGGGGGGGGSSVDRESGRRGGGESRPDLYEEVRRRERETVVSGQRDQYARRPPTTKSSLAAQSHRRSHLQDDDYDYDANSRRSHSSNKPPPHHQQQQQAHRDRGAARRESPPAAAAAAPPRKRTVEEMAMVAEKKRKLMSKYG
jgi:pre-mRNA-splicing factor 38B